MLGVDDEIKTESRERRQAMKFMFAMKMLVLRLFEGSSHFIMKIYNAAQQ